MFSLNSECSLKNEMLTEQQLEKFYYLPKIPRGDDDFQYTKLLDAFESNATQISLMARFQIERQGQVRCHFLLKCNDGIQIIADVTTQNMFPAYGSLDLEHHIFSVVFQSYEKGEFTYKGYIISPFSGRLNLADKNNKAFILVYQSSQKFQIHLLSHHLEKQKEYRLQSQNYLKLEKVLKYIVLNKNQPTENYVTFTYY